MTITEHPEFKTIMEEAYNKAYLHGVEDERERCAKVAESCIPANENDGEFLRCGAKMAREIAVKIRSGE